MRLQTMPTPALARLIYDSWTAPDAPVFPALYGMSASNDNGTLHESRPHVERFLRESRGWRGPIARAVKAELRRRLKLT